MDGDLALFEPTFGAATVIVRPGSLAASGAAKVAAGRKWCIDGDEASVAVSQCPYFTPQYGIPGSGTLTVQSLEPAHRCTKLRNTGAAALLVGPGFKAKLTVSVAAMMPTPTGPQPDPTREYRGRGRFSTTNRTLRGT